MPLNTLYFAVSMKQDIGISTGKNRSLPEIRDIIEKKRADYEKTLAYCNVFAIADSVTKEDFVPNFACHDGLKSFDRSQPPVGSMTALEIYHRYHEDWFLSRIYERLLRWNQWFFEHRQTDNQLMTWGSNPIGPYWDSRFESADSGVNNWRGASFESGLDIEDCYSLAEIARILGYADDTEKLISRAEAFEERMEELWDETSGWYLNRRTDTGEGCHSPKGNSDPFYHWGGLPAYISLI